MSNFIVQALKGQDITIFGSGFQTRSFCYVDDLISGLIKLFFTDNVYVPVNLGNPKPITMIQLAEEIIQLTGTKSKIIRKDLPQDDPTNREPDIARAKLLLSWEPTIARVDGLQKTISYFKERMNA